MGEQSESEAPTCEGCGELFTGSGEKCANCRDNWQDSSLPLRTRLLNMLSYRRIRSFFIIIVVSLFSDRDSRNPIGSLFSAILSALFIVFGIPILIEKLDDWFGITITDRQIYIFNILVIAIVIIAFLAFV